MNANSKTENEGMPEWAKFPTPNTIPSGWDVSAFGPAQEPEEETETRLAEKKKDLWSV